MSGRTFTIKATTLDIDLLSRAMRSNPILIRDSPEGSRLERALMKQNEGRDKSVRIGATFEINSAQAKILEELLLPKETDPLTYGDMRLMQILDQVRAILYNASRQ